MIAKPNPMRDLCVNMIASPANCADVFTKPSVHMVTPRPHPRGSPLRDSRSACPYLRSPLSTGFGHGAPVFAPPRRATPPPPSVATPLRLLGWATVPRAAYDAIVAKISNSNSDERKSALLALALVWIAVRRFSSPVASLLAARWARVRDALLRIALRIVRALSVGAAASPWLRLRPSRSLLELSREGCFRCSCLTVASASRGGVLMPLCALLFSLSFFLS